MNYLLDSWRPGYHLSPPDGWMSDPVGLCVKDGIYHIFFQYSPEDAAGKKPRVWGHFMGKDLMHMKYAGVAFPAGEYEKSGAYPGSALVEDDMIHLFYTGNIKEDGPYDHITEGRISNQMRISSRDGVHFKDRRLLLTNKDYPPEVTLKVRDPKVWKEHDTYFMVLAAGSRMNFIDKDPYPPAAANGCCLIYSSKDLVHWNYERYFYLPEGFGYQWECPDFFHIEGCTVLSICPQGVAHEEFHFQNHYSAGYFFVKGESIGGQIVTRDSFHEWDQGFDFYAPQTFLDGNGRRILIAWAGMPDARYFNLTANKEGWQGLLTVPRELSVRDGRLLQKPVTEIESLRQTKLTPMNGEPVTFENGTGELLVGPGKNSVRIRIGSLLQPRVVTLEYESGVATLTLDSSNMPLSSTAAATAMAEGAVISASSLVNEKDIAGAAAEAAGGRTVRRCQIGELRELRILVDTSVVEIFLNDGEHVMTTRYYPNHKDSQGRLVTVEYGSRSCTAWEYRETESPFEQPY